MNNTVLKIVAGLLLAGAIVVALIGIKLSQPTTATPQPAAPESAPTEAVVVAARQIKAGQTLGPADLTIKVMPARPPRTFKQTGELLGKVAGTEIPSGSPLTPDQFKASSLADLLRWDERAVAVHIDEVIGVGGYVNPGDHVDVLLFLPEKRETNDTTSAQIAIQDARILTFGEATQFDADQKNENEPSPSKEGKDGQSKSKDRKERRAIRSAVLAVREADATRLMLAASSGQLRLSLRPHITTPPDPLGMYAADKGNARRPDRGRNLTTLPEFAPGGKKTEKTPAGTPGVIIQNGTDERRLTKNEL